MKQRINSLSFVLQEKQPWASLKFQASDQHFQNQHLYAVKQLKRQRQSQFKDFKLSVAKKNLTANLVEIDNLRNQISLLRRRQKKKQQYRESNFGFAYSVTVQSRKQYNESSVQQYVRLTELPRHCSFHQLNTLTVDRICPTFSKVCVLQINIQPLFKASVGVNSSWQKTIQWAQKTELSSKSPIYSQSLNYSCNQATPLACLETATLINEQVFPSLRQFEHCYLQTLQLGMQPRLNFSPVIDMFEMFATAKPKQLSYYSTPPLIFLPKALAQHKTVLSSQNITNISINPDCSLDSRVQALHKQISALKIRHIAEMYRQQQRSAEEFQQMLKKEEASEKERLDLSARVVALGEQFAKLMEKGNQRRSSLKLHEDESDFDSRIHFKKQTQSVYIHEPKPKIIEQLEKLDRVCSIKSKTQSIINYPEQRKRLPESMPMSNHPSLGWQASILPESMKKQEPRLLPEQQLKFSSIEPQLPQQNKQFRKIERHSSKLLELEKSVKQQDEWCLRIHSKYLNQPLTKSKFSQFLNDTLHENSNKQRNPNQEHHSALSKRSQKKRGTEFAKSNLSIDSRRSAGQRLTVNFAQQSKAVEASSEEDQKGQQRQESVLSKNEQLKESIRLKQQAIRAINRKITRVASIKLNLSGDQLSEK